jgi:hypothetical protein
MNESPALAGLAIGVCAFALAWAVVRHFTGLAAEHGTALLIAILVGLLAGIAFAVFESRLFETRRRRRER